MLCCVGTDVCMVWCIGYKGVYCVVWVVRCLGCGVGVMCSLCCVCV